MASSKTLLQQDYALQGLAVALQHEAVASDQRIMCTLLQVSKAWRALVQQSAACITRVTFSRDLSIMQHAKLAGFAGWLGKHPGLIQTLEIDCIAPIAPRYLGDAAPLQAASRQLIEFALQAAAAASSCSGAPLRLQAFSCSMPITAGSLAALPAVTLTSLDIRVEESNCYSVLSKLSNLRQLSLDLEYVTEDTTNKYLAEIGKVKELTQLQLFDVATASHMQLLPAQLQQLELDYVTGSGTGALVSLQHLTNLRRLALKAESLATGSLVPGSLESLELDAEWPADGLLGFVSMQQVTSVDISNPSLGREHCEALQHLAQLKQLSLTLLFHKSEMEVAAAWHGLPLRALHVVHGSMTPTELQQFMRRVVAATQLTSLAVVIESVTAEVDVPRLAVCEHLRVLKHLDSLALSIGRPDNFEVQDAEHLSALVALESLQLCVGGSGPFLDAATLSLLAVSLTGLRYLSVNEDGERYPHRIASIYALPVIGRLTAMENLNLMTLNEGDAQRGLQYLTSLSRLTTLQGFHKAGDEALRGFWATVNGQQ